ncbi:MAG: glycosyltransferase family 39 protein [Deltaproteobacteria bacterium]|nr:glycosyltransferase family 39 protein [Deltaproteobacteria bacterium]
MKIIDPQPGPPWLTRGLETTLVACLLLGQVFFLAGVAARMSPAGDERTFYLYGHRILFEGSFERDDERMFNSKMPAQVINVLPQYLGEKLKLWPFTRLSRNVGPVPPRAPHVAYLFWARLALICLVPGFGLIFYLWARRLYGPLPGLVLLLLLAISPNLTAVWSLIVNDGLMAAGFLAALFFCRRYTLKPTAGRLIAAGFFLGLAQLVKNTAVLLAIIVPVAWLLETWSRTWTELTQGRLRVVGRRILKAGGVLVAWLAITLVVVNFGFGWQGFGASVKEVNPRSAPFRNLPPALQKLPLPLPYDFLNGLDQVIYDDQNSLTIGLVYLGGRANHMGWAAYYLKGLLWKLPLGLLGLLGLALVLRWQRVLTPDDAWLIVPVAVIMLNMSLRTTVQLGVKYVLIIVPFLILFSGRVLVFRPNKWPVFHYAAVGLLAAWMIFSSLKAYPNYVSYFNETVNPNQAYKYLAHYDLSAGQGRDRAIKWAKAQNPPVEVNPHPLKPGRVLVSGGALLALHGEDRWRLLRESYQPQKVVAGEYFLFEINNLTPRQWTLSPRTQP